MRIIRTTIAAVLALTTALAVTACGNLQPGTQAATTVTASPSAPALESAAPITVTAPPAPAPVTVTAPPAPAPITVTAPPAPAPVTVTAPPAAPTVIIVPDPTTVYPDYYNVYHPVSALPAGLYCRDLKAMGYDWNDAIAYWNLWGGPDRMDADLNGIPCETVY